MFEGNLAAVQIYQYSSDQVIPAGMNGVTVALRHESIWANIRGFKKRFNIIDESEVFEQVLILYRIILKERAIASSEEP
ncbi:MAG: hypothetical protein GY714_32215 [Desulfobacterales bacterium]|nr:hypothetical protein [Desulfobacterales bacterium]